MSHILVLEDDRKSRELLIGCFQAEGFRTTSFDDNAKGLKQAVSGPGRYDLVVLSVMLSARSGVEILKFLRPRFDIPVLMLATREKKPDGITCLEMGADALMLKPFNPRELIAYVRAILRRTGDHRGGGPTPEKIRIGDVELDSVNRSARHLGKPVHLTPIEFGFLEMLLRSAGRVITSDKLAEGVLGRTLSSYDRSVSVHVGNLRKKLGRRLGEIERIVTVRGQGYVYVNPREHEQNLMAR